MDNFTNKKSGFKQFKEKLFINIPGIFMCGIFGFLGTLFLVIGIVNFFSVNAEQKNTVETTATIIGFVHKSDSKYPVVTYEANGEQYETRLTFMDSSMKEGDRIQILYNPQSPEETHPTGVTAYLFGIISGGIGGVFVIIAVLLGMLFFAPSSSLKFDIPDNDTRYFDANGNEVDEEDF